MYNVLLFQEPQSLEDLYSETSDQRQRHTSEIVDFNELVQVDTEQFEGNEQVLPEVDAVLHPDDVHLVVWVILLQVLHDVELNLGLMSEFLFVPNDFNSDYLTCLVVFAFQSLSE